MQLYGDTNIAVADMPFAMCYNAIGMVLAEAGGSVLAQCRHAAGDAGIEPVYTLKSDEVRDTIKIRTGPVPGLTSIVFRGV